MTMSKTVHAFSAQLFLLVVLGLLVPTATTTSLTVMGEKDRELNANGPIPRTDLTGITLFILNDNANSENAGYIARYNVAEDTSENWLVNLNHPTDVAIYTERSAKWVFVSHRNGYDTVGINDKKNKGSFTQTGALSSTFCTEMKCFGGSQESGLIALAGKYSGNKGEQLKDADENVIPIDAMAMSTSHLYISNGHDVFHFVQHPTVKSLHQYESIVSCANTNDEETVEALEIVCNEGEQQGNDCKLYATTGTSGKLYMYTNPQTADPKLSIYDLSDTNDSLALFLHGVTSVKHNGTKYLFLTGTKTTENEEKKAFLLAFRLDSNGRIEENTLTVLVDPDEDAAQSRFQNPGRMGAWTQTEGEQMPNVKSGNKLRVVPPRS